jgi:hypothetical protein
MAGREAHPAKRVAFMNLIAIVHVLESFGMMALTSEAPIGSPQYARSLSGRLK